MKHIMEKFCRLKQTLRALSLLVVLSFLPALAHATTLEQAVAVRNNFQFPLGSVEQSSYDGPRYEAFKPFEAFTGSEILSISSFSGPGQGSFLEVHMLSESAYFDGRNANFANNFGVTDSAGNFISLLDSVTNDPGSSASIFQAAQDEFTFALQSPEALFSSLDSSNSDGMAHIIAKEVVQDGEVVVSPTSLRSNEPLSFQLHTGDIILFVEDMLADGNLRFLGIPTMGDFDYNDMVLVVRQRAIPEPCTLLLLGAALLGAPRIKRKQD